ncbi:MAG: hypothetical protein H0X40_03275 [Chthoniobacterales bacterium]|nr:hypothetical protein [Chthoniobacterales bacterium]
MRIRLSQKLAIAGEMMRYLSVSRKWSLTPIVVLLLLLGLIDFLFVASSTAPFIYTLF